MVTSGYSHSEVKSGIFLTLCLALLIAMLFKYGEWSRAWRGRQEISVVFSSVTALRPNAPVRYNGFEVGRVKDIRILHLKEGDLKHLPHMTVADLDKLPLTDSERKLLKSMTPGEFDAELEKILLKRTMLNTVLEVINEHDASRFREDDDVRITSTLMGDTSVEIASGVGPPLAESRM